MNVLLDTNIVLDVFLRREPFFTDSAKVFDHVVSKNIRGYLCATTVTTISYLLEKYHGVTEMREIISRLLNHFEIAPVDKNILISALNTNYPDYEDGVVIESTKNFAVNAIITRDQTGFKNIHTHVFTPDMLLNFIKAT